MFNKITKRPPNSEEQYEFSPCHDVVEQEGEVITTLPKSDLNLTNPRVKYRSVTVYERLKNGLVKSVNTENFVSPSLETSQQINQTLQSIDESVSKDAAYEKMLNEVQNTKNVDNNE